MCGGGGGGSASQDQLAQEQNLQMQRNNARTQNEELQRQQAIAQINQLYGYDSDVAGTQVLEQTYTPPPVQVSAPAPTPEVSTTPSNLYAQTRREDAFNGVRTTSLKDSSAAPAWMQPAQSSKGPTFSTNPFSQRYDASSQRAQRQEGYNTVRQNALAVALDSLSKQRDDTSRDIRFNVARSGLAGGSVDIDQNQLLADKYSQGVIQANSNADGIVNGVRSRDEATRADLISRINAGMDANSASQSALAQIQNNQAAANFEGSSNLLNNFFNGLASGVGGYQTGMGQYDYQQRNPSNSYSTGGSNGRIS